MKKKEKVQTDPDNELYEFILGYSKLVYDNALYREQSLIQQATNMQIAFSFVIAAVFMVAAIVVEYRGRLSLEYLILVFSSISISLILSLFFATMAQNRYKRAIPQKIGLIKENILNNKEKLQSDKEKYEYQIQTIIPMSDSLDDCNNKRVTWINLSMRIFYFALLLCLFWFVITLIKIL